ncbi:MAG: LemA family protein [Burkholderiaceae bacterium]
MGWFIFLGLVILVIFWAIGAYNRMVGLRNRFKNAFAQIDVQLKRRYDLIPNLVETARAYMNHERETLEAVIDARHHAQAADLAAAAKPDDAQALTQLASAEGLLSGALTRFFAVAEAYPDLKADQTMMQLAEELSATENKVAFARQAFNDAVMSYNTATEQFPANLLAQAFKFKLAEPLVATETADEKKAVTVKF